MKTPRTYQESQITPRTNVAVVEASFAGGLESELHSMSLVLSRIVDCGGIGSDEMFEDARELLQQHTDRRTNARAALAKYQPTPE